MQRTCLREESRMALGRLRLQHEFKTQTRELRREPQAQIPQLQKAFHQPSE